MSNFKIYLNRLGSKVGSPAINLSEKNKIGNFFSLALLPFAETETENEKLKLKVKNVCACACVCVCV